MIPFRYKRRMVSAVIVAAGRGARFGPDRDKLFLEVAGRPVVAHTWARFETAPSVDNLVVVVRDGLQPAFSELAAQYGFRKPFRFAPGGQERQDSVWNGLQALPPDTEVVAIQDAARPCTDLELIEATITAARETGAAVAASPVVDTIKESDDSGRTAARTLDRAKLWAVQTPQAFHVEIIRRALVKVRERGLHITDDTAACELIGQPVRLISSLRPNPKVTVPEDLPMIELLLR
jgi:2-C-methyl-D-erythritol 4-phosphate cytidylyltransferase